MNKPIIDNIDNIKNIDKYIEGKIEEKLTSLLLTLPDKIPEKNNGKPIYEFTVNELYKNTLQTIIDIINDITELVANRKNLGEETFRKELFECFMKDNRKVYVGIVLIFLAFILYFLDSLSI